jgi:hypothetical protein
MAKATPNILHFNRGRVSRLGLARVDIKRTAFSAETMTNWVPRVMGSMMLRPGFEYLGQARARPKMMDFVFSIDDTALVEATNLAIRFWVDDVLLSRPTVTATVANGTFDTNLTNWTDNDEAGAVSDWAAGGYMQLVGSGTNAAIRDQQVTVAAAYQGVEHALRITINRGPVILRIGSSAGGDEYVEETELGTGIHSIAFTPTGDFYIRLMNRLVTISLVDSVEVESAGVVQLGSPWATSDLRRLRWSQSADVLFVACRGYQQRKIERRAKRSWSIVLYQPKDGPFRIENTGTITLTPSAITGNITITASKAIFKASQVGGLYRLTSSGQRVTANIAAENTFTSQIVVTNANEARRFTIELSGTWVATVTLQRSVGVTGNWIDLDTYTGNVATTYQDSLDNQTVYYRIGVKTGAYVSGTVVATLTYTLGSITGTARITAFTSNTVVSAEVLLDLGGATATDVWSEGSWSDRRGWPTSVAFYEGRLWWAGKNGVWGSISDAFDGFDPAFEGAAAPINRTIGSGPVDDINWVLPMQRLLLGAAGAEHSVRSTTFDEPLSAANFNIKEASTQGSAAEVAAVKMDSAGVFVQRAGTRLYELAFDPQSYDYGATDLTALIPEIGEPSIVAIAVQRQPDTRLHCVRSDGTVALAVIDRTEKVLSWQDVETDGDIVDVVVLPGLLEDSVYYVVERGLGSSGVISLTVTSAGTGYTAIPTLSFSGGGGSGATGSVTVKVITAAVGDAGSGYAAGNVLTLVGGTFTAAATLTVDTVDGSGAVLTFSITSAGDYSALPGATVTGGAGANFQTANLTFAVNSATITHNGGAYTSAPTVTVTGTGTGAAITAAISTSTLSAHYLEKWALESECRGGTLNKQADSFIVYSGTQTVVGGGFVSSLSVVDGIGYIAVPTLAFSGGGGSGATGEVTLTLVDPSPLGLVSSFGSGYSVGDVLTVVGGTSTQPARLQVRQVFGTGLVLTAAIIDGGSYTVIPASPVSVTGGTGSGCRISSIWGLGVATVTSPGSGYTSPPTIVLSALPTAGVFPVAGSVQASISVATTTASAGTSSISGLGHHEGKEVVVWGDGVDLSPVEDGVQTTYTVVGGSISLGDVSVGSAVVGLPYSAQWKSTKLAYADNQSAAIGQRKAIRQLGLILADTHSKGIEFGPDFDTMDPLPDLEEGAEVDYDTVHEAYDFDMSAFPGGWDTDSRLCLEANAPRPCTVLAAVMAVESNEKP